MLSLLSSFCLHFFSIFNHGRRISARKIIQITAKRFILDQILRTTAYHPYPSLLNWWQKQAASELNCWMSCFRTSTNKFSSRVLSAYFLFSACRPPLSFVNRTDSVEQVTSPATSRIDYQGNISVNRVFYTP